MFHSYFKRKYEKVLTFNIVCFPNFEISVSHLLALTPGALIRVNMVLKIYALPKYLYFTRHDI